MTQPSPVDAPPVCPRHPDRVSYVRCQRCNRPVCPECQRPAPVGVQCVDCVREAQRATRPTQTVLGFRAARGQRPVVTITLITICVVVYLCQLVFGWSFTSELAFAPSMAASEPWRFITSAFLHGSITHILFNMLSLWVLGSFLEPVLGRVRYLALYLISAVGGSVAILLLSSPPAFPGDPSSTWYTATLGASTAIFGLFGAVFLTLRHLNRDTSIIVGTLVLNIVLSFLVPNISWQGHLGGLFVGAVVAACMLFARKLPQAYRWALGIGGPVLVCVFLVGASIAKLSAVGAL